MSAPSPRPSREDLTFDSQGIRCSAWLYRPTSDGAEGASTPPPIIVMAHGFGGVRALRLDAFGERFADAGYAVLIFDYRYFGDSEGEPRRLLSIGRQLDDWRAAIAFARSLEGIDNTRVVAWGSSLSGGHTLRIAREDPALAAVIAQVPHVCGPISAAALGIIPALRVGVVAFEDLIRGLVGLAPRYVKSFAKPGDLGVMTSPDAAPGYARMLAESDLPADYPCTVPARVALRMPFYSPGRFTGKITSPVLVQVTNKDVVTPPFATKMASRRLSKGEVRDYDCGHFDAYVEPFFPSFVADQIDFLQRHVPISGDRQQ